MLKAAEAYNMAVKDTCDLLMMMANMGDIKKEYAEDFSKLAAEVLRMEVEVNDDRWISVEDELPEESIDVIVTTRGSIAGVSCDDRVFFENCGYEKGRWYINGYNESNCEVIAWMPIPKPYMELPFMKI